MATVVLFFSLLTLCLGAQADDHRGKIIGGDTVDITMVPYQVAVEVHGSQLCGGTVLSDRVILTAASCLEFDVEEIQVRAGSSVRNDGGVVIMAEKAIQHPKFQLRTSDYDVGVIYLNGSLSFGANITTVGFASEKPAPGDLALIAGWGRTNDSTESVRDLHAVTVPVMDEESCRGFYGDQITTRMFCAGQDAKKFCYGDTGGALVINFVAVGIASWSQGCEVTTPPEVYTNLAFSEIRLFIKDALNDQLL